MRTKTLLASLAAVGVASSAYAVSPYDTAYGIQWNYVTGSTFSTNVADNAGEVYASPDGSAWITEGHSGNGGGFSPWGDAKNGGHFDSGVGHIAGNGSVLYGTGLPAIADYVSENQNYMRANSGMQGTSFIAGWGPNNANAHWDNQTPAQVPGMNGSPMIVRFAPVVTDPLVDLDLKKNTNLLISVRQEGAAYSQTSNVAWFGGGYQSGDVVTVGDGAIDGSGTTNYSPYIFRYDADTGAQLGPAKQGNSDGRTHYNDVSVDETNNRVYGSGYALTQGAAVTSFIDFTGDGVPELTYNPATPNTSKGFLAVFDATTMAYVNSIGWESSEGNDQIRDNIATDDGGVIAVGRTNGNLKSGASNPAFGTEDVYVAKYDANLNLVWDWQAETAVGDVGYSVDTDTDGNVYVGVQAFGADGSGNDDVQVLKFDSAGNLVWTKTIDNGGTQESIVGSSASAYDKTRIYVSSEHNATAGGTDWSSISDYNGANDDGIRDNDEILLQKLVPGDFDASGMVDMTDVMMVDTATATTLVGVDTYDFDEDGNSSFLDVSFFYLNVLDNLPGDTDGDGDIDDSDLGTSFSNYTGPVGASGGKTALDGDTDGDGDVDDSDLGSAFAGYTGPLGPASVPEPTSLALLGLGGLLIARRRRA